MIFLVSTALLLILTASGLVSAFRRWRTRKALAQKPLCRLENLTESEKAILRYYVINGTRTNVLKIDDGVVGGLVSTGIIYRAAAMGDLMDGFAHNISDFAWDYLSVNPHLLDGKTNDVRNDVGSWRGRRLTGRQPY